MRRVYLDYAATTPLAPEVERAMRPYWSQVFGNPGSIHSFGQEASRAVFLARERAAKALNCGYQEVVFMGSATEANNLALRGTFSAIFQNNSYLKEKDSSSTTKVGTQNDRRLLRFARNDGRGTTRNDEGKLRIITTAIEHSSVLETCKDLEKHGVEVVYLPVDGEGFVDLKKLKAALNERTVLVSVGMVNSEIGVVQPIAEIAKIIKDFKKEKAKNNNVISTEVKRSGEISVLGINSNNEISRQAMPTGRQARDDNDDIGNIYPLFHTDAVQAFQFLKCDVKELGVDSMTLSAHKIYGPKGIGLLYVKKDPSPGSRAGVRMTNTGAQDDGVVASIITGGGQEWGLRGGTENVAGIVGFGKAVELTEKLRVKESKRISGLRDYFWRELKKIVPKAEVNGWYGYEKIASASPRNDKSSVYRNDKSFVHRNDGKKSLRVPTLVADEAIYQRIPNNLNVYFPGRTAQDLLIELDLAGVAASAVSACSARLAQPSHVIEALRQAQGKLWGKDRPCSSLRFSLGKPTTKEEVNYVLRVMKKIFY